jgi:4-aminobutyrate--pyruvate transaminase
MARGVIVRAGPDAVFVCPPLIITPAQIDELMDALAGALDEAHAVAEQRGLMGPVRNEKAVA